jgi:hypothetical protein
MTAYLNIGHDPARHHPSRRTPRLAMGDLVPLDNVSTFASRQAWPASELVPTTVIGGADRARRLADYLPRKTQPEERA